MSVNTMNRIAMHRRAAAAAPPAGGPDARGGGDAPGGGGEPPPIVAPGAPAPPPTTTVLSDLSRYVPTEVLTVYVAWLGAYGITERITDGKDLDLGMVAMLGFTLVLAPLTVWIDWQIKQRKLPAAERSSLPVYNPVAAAIAFFAWAFALPASPFVNESWYAAAWAGLAALVVSYGLGKADQLFSTPQAPEPAPANP